MKRKRKRKRKRTKQEQRRIWQRRASGTTCLSSSTSVPTALFSMALSRNMSWGRRG